MKEFDFYQDQKVSLWNRFFFKVKAENYDKAVEIVKSIKNENVLCVEGDDIKFDYSETLLDTQEQLSLKDNNGNPTLEFFNEQGDHIADNSNDTIQSVEVTALSVEDLEILGFDTENITTQDLKNIAYKMDLSETFWIELEQKAEKYGLKKNTNTKNNKR